MSHTTIQLFRSWSHWWRLFWRFRKLHLMRTMEYRKNFVFWVTVSLAWTAWQFFTVGILSNVNQGIGGWSSNEILLLVSLFTMLDCVVWSVFYHNMTAYTKAIFSGEIQRFLLMPVDTQTLLMMQGNNYTNVFRFSVGLVAFLISIQRLAVPLTLPLIGGLIFLLTVSATFIYSLWFTLSTLAFWVEKLDNINELIPNFRHIWEVPKSVFNGWLSTLFTVFVPFGLLITLPSEWVLQRMNVSWALYLTSLAVIMYLVSRWFFKISIKKVTGVGE